MSCSEDQPATATDGTTTQDLSHADKVHKTQAQLESLEAETKQAPLTSDLYPMAQLRTNYQSEQTYFVRGVDDLSQRYTHYRSTRGDGNCYYRAILYELGGLFVQGQNAEEHRRLLQYFKNDSLSLATAIGGYSEMAIEIFHETLVEFWEKLPKINATELHLELNEENATSDYCTWYLRVVAATFCKADPDRFLPFLLAEDNSSSGSQYMDVPAFCAAQIEPMGSEATQITVLAVAEALRVRVVVEYLDGHAFEKSLTKHEFGPPGAEITLTLLYRPGHYDILTAAK